MTKLSVAIVGAGIGGLAAAACLRRVGIDVTVYEQAQRFTRVGAGIQQSPNAVRVLRRLGLEPRLRDIAFQPAAALNRQSDTGELLWERAMGASSEARYGAPYLVLHRGDLHAVLASAVPDEHHPARSQAGRSGAARARGTTGFRRWWSAPRPTR